VFCVAASHKTITLGTIAGAGTGSARASTTDTTASNTLSEALSCCVTARTPDDPVCVCVTGTVLNSVHRLT
jgi:hypothetical protein